MKKKKIILIASTALTLALSGGIGASFAKAAEAETAWLVDGACIRYTANSYGLRYIFQVTEGAYDKEATYGILIAPEAYVTEGGKLYKGELSIENVFGEESIYGWAEKDAEGNWKEYTGTKTQIINLATSQFNDKTATIDGKTVNVKEFYGSMTNIRPENIAVEFRAVGYIRTGEEGNYTYKLVGDDDNVRSMTYVAQRAIEDTSSKAPSESQKKALQQTYIDSVTDIQSSYTQKYYLEQADGTYVEEESLTSVNDTLVGSTVKTTIDDEVDMWIREIDGYVFDADNAKNKTSGKVYANDKLVLSAYYNKQVESADLGLVDVKTQTSINVPVANEYAGYTKAVYKVVGATETAVNASWSDNALTVDGTYNGVYRVKIENVNGTAVQAFTFDAYDSTADFEWNAIVAGAGVATVGTTDEDEILTDTRVAIATAVANGAEGSAENYYEITSSTADYYNFTFSALHSKAYYEQYLNQGRALSFEYCMTSTNAEAAYVDVYQTGAETDVWTKLPLNTWTKATVSLDTLVENWGNGLLKFGAFYRQTNDRVGALIECDSTTAYVGNLKFAVDYTQITPIDAGNVLKSVNGANTTSYVLKDNLIGAGEAAKFDYYASLGDIVWKTTTLSGTNVTGEATEVENGTLSFGTNAALRTYKVEAYVSIDGTEYLIYTGNIDFYNENDGIVWNDMTQADLARMTYKAGYTSYGVETAVHETLGQSYYYYFTSDSNVVNMWFSVMPMHSVEYYQMFQAEYSDYILTFDMTATGAGNYNYGIFLQGQDTWGPTQKLSKDETYTINPDLVYSKWNVEYTYTLDNLIANYADLSSTTVAGDTAGFLILNSNATARYLYLANCTFTQRTYTDATATVEKNTLENGAYDVVELFTAYETEQERLTALTNNGKLIWTVTLDGESVALNGTTLENVAIGAYTITAKDVQDNVICSGTLTVNRTVLTETGATQLIDVSKTSNLDLLDYVGEEYKTSLSGVNGLTWQLAKVNSDKTVSATGTTLTTADAEKVLYQIQACDADGVLYTGINLDLYNPTDGIVWNDMTDANLAVMSSSASYTSSSITVVEHEVDGTTYQSYLYSRRTTTNNAGKWYRVLPMHSVEYYEMLHAEYSDYVLTFNVGVYNTTGTAQFIPFLVGRNSWGTAGYQIYNKDITVNPTTFATYWSAENKAYTYTLDNLIANYSGLSSKSTTVNNQTGFIGNGENLKNCDMYIYNMQFVKRTYENTETTSVDVATLTDNTYDLTTLFTAYATEQQRLATLTTAGKLVWTVVDGEGNPVTVTGTSVTAVAGATYTVTAKDIGGNVICAGAVTFTTA